MACHSVCPLLTEWGAHFQSIRSEDSTLFSVKKPIILAVWSSDIFTAIFDEPQSIPCGAALLSHCFKASFSFTRSPYAPSWMKSYVAKQNQTKQSFTCFPIARQLRGVIHHAMSKAHTSRKFSCPLIHNPQINACPDFLDFMNQVEATIRYLAGRQATGKINWPEPKTKTSLKLQDGVTDPH